MKNTIQNLICASIVVLVVLLGCTGNGGNGKKEEVVKLYDISDRGLEYCYKGYVVVEIGGTTFYRLETHYHTGNAGLVACPGS